MPSGTLTIEQRVASFEAYQKNMGLMLHIARSMREIPELPSEQPVDTHPLSKVEFPEAGGVLTYMDGFPLPYKGFPLGENVERIDLIKKTFRNILSSFFHSLKSRSKFKLALLALVPWLFQDLIRAMVYNLYRQIERFKIKPKCLCDAMRELHRAMSIEHEELTSQREMRYMLRDIITMIMELDNAYRFRFQDIAPELDKDALKANPSKELLRLLALMQSRETTQEIRDTWTLVRFALPWYLRLNRSLTTTLVETLLALDVEKVKLSPEDVQFATPRKDYKFAFMNN